MERAETPQPGFAPTSERNDQRWKSARPWQCGACLGWCAFAGWWAFIRDDRVPLLTFVNLGFHELGHLICYLVPIVGTVVTAAAGSTMQCLVPLGLAIYFLVRRRDRLASAVCLAWAATNFQEAAVYIADAPFQRLQLIGGEHDWATVLGPEHLNRLQDAGSIAATVRGIGVLVLVVAVGLCLFGLATSRPDDGDTDGHDLVDADDPREQFLV